MWVFYGVCWQTNQDLLSNVQTSLAREIAKLCETKSRSFTRAVFTFIQLTISDQKSLAEIIIHDDTWISNAISISSNFHQHFGNSFSIIVELHENPESPHTPPQWVFRSFPFLTCEIYCLRRFPMMMKLGKCNMNRRLENTFRWRKLKFFFVGKRLRIGSRLSKNIQFFFLKSSLSVFRNTFKFARY